MQDAGGSDGRQCGRGGMGADGQSKAEGGHYFGFAADTVLGAIFDEGLLSLKQLAEAEAEPGDSPDTAEDTGEEVVEEAVEEASEEASEE